MIFFGIFCILYFVFYIYFMLFTGPYQFELVILFVIIPGVPLLETGVFLGDV